MANKRELEAFVLAKIEERKEAKKAKDFATADAIRDAAQNEGGGIVGAGVGIGVGAAIGQTIVNGMPGTTQAPAAGTCSNCNASLPQGAKFCPSCGQKL